METRYDLVNRRFGSALVCAAVLAAAVSSAAALSKPVDPHVAFTAVGPAGLKIEGETAELDVAEQGDKIVVTVPLRNLHTGIALRDHHLKDKYLEVGQFPKSELTIERSALKLPESGPVTADLHGVLSLHGKSKPVTVHYEATKSGTTTSVHGKFRINITDYGVSVPSYLGVTVKPDVDVEASFRIGG